jgi:hypothetical protein
MPGLSFVTLLAYDYRYCYQAIRSYYDIADEIILGLDADRLTWSKRPFAIDLEEVRAFVAEVDRDRKIRVIERDFHGEDTPMKNDTRERSLLSREAAPGNWVVQVDADEILMNAADFRAWLLAEAPADHLILARWLSVFKVFGDQVLVVDPPGEAVPVATMARGEYVMARLTGQPQAMSPLQVLHFSWGRTPQELRQKLDNWSHAQDFNVEDFYAFWDGVTLDNYTQARDFHPLDPPVWGALKRATLHFVPGART